MLLAMPLCVLGSWVLCGCGPAGDPDAGPGSVEPPVVSDEDAMTRDLSSLRAAEDAWARRADELTGSPGGIHAALEAARLARISALRDGADDPLSRARLLLEAASLRRNVPGACEAALELARVLARDLAEPGAAFVVAYRTARRFDGEGDADCAAEARRMSAVLEPFRADNARLYAIDADPNRGDPSVGLESSAEAEESSSLDALELWTRERRASGTVATLGSISTFGEEGAPSARIVLALDAIADFTHAEVAAEGDLPRRLTLTLEGARLADAVLPSVVVGAGGLLRVRASGDDEAVRVVCDLGPDAEARIYALPEPFRIVVDFSGTAEGTGPVRAVDLVVLDPGHGGNDYGARAFGLHEADLALDLALRVRDVLARRAPQIRVILTRESDTFVSLEQRAAMANAIDADAFISIHLNAADEEVEHGGITTFVLDTEGDRAALRLAARENGTSTAAVTELQRILAGLHREEQVAGSRRLAERVHRSLLVGGRTVLPRLHDRHVRSAMFYVLVGAVMPAILVEASFMTREDEARALRTETYRDAIARGIADGIVRYAAP